MEHPVRHQADSAAVAHWLFAVCGLIFLMVIVGGATRLTESGLSITHWSPVSGIIPPLDEAGWQQELARYRQSPEYQQINKGMSLADFKAIYWWEYVHRLLGRLIGVAFAVPFLWFLVRRRIPSGFGAPLAGLFLLGGLQGAVGWWMVRSGLVDRPDVSHYRLAVHLGLALVIFGLALWLGLSLSRRPEGCGDRSLAGTGGLVLALLAAQIVLGAFVAGLNAGFAFNTWPLMGETFVPDGLWTLAPAWINVAENPVMVQFLHRLVAYALVLAGLAWAARALRSPDAGSRKCGLVLALALLGQLVLGIATVVLGVPVWLGTAHQGGAVVLLAAIIVLLHRSVTARP